MRPRVVSGDWRVESGECCPRDSVGTGVGGWECEVQVVRGLLVTRESPPCYGWH